MNQATADYTRIEIEPVRDAALRQAGYMNEYRCWQGEWCVRNGITKFTDVEDVKRRIRSGMPMNPPTGPLTDSP